MTKSFDVVIVGGGVIGSSVAYFLSANPDFQGSICVIERDPYYMASSSSLSASSIRQQFGTRPNIMASAFGIEFLRRVGEHLSVDGEPADIGLREPGYLILGTEADIPKFQEKHEIQKACGYTADLMTPEELARRFPWLSVDGLGIGSYGPDREGWFDGPSLLQAFKKKARSQKVEYIAGNVVDFGSEGSKLTSAILQDGSIINGGTFVLATGAHSGQVARTIGFDLPVVPRKRCVFVVDMPEKIEGAPFIFDPSDIWLRQEGHLWICGTTPAVENADDDFSLDVDYDLFDEIIWPALYNRIPYFEKLKMLRAWAGHYEYNLFDHSALIGPAPTRSNLLLATGFSGHGMMHSPAAGAGIADLVAYGEYRQVDLTEFSFDRIARNVPILEHVY